MSVSSTTSKLRTKRRLFTEAKTLRLFAAGASGLLKHEDLKIGCLNNVIMFHVFFVAKNLNIR